MIIQSDIELTGATRDNSCAICKRARGVICD